MEKKYTLSYSRNSFFITQLGYDTQVMGIADVETIINDLHGEIEGLKEVIATGGSCRAYNEPRDKPSWSN